MLRSRTIFTSLFACVAFSASALANPVFDAISQQRYPDAIAMAAGGDSLMFAYAEWATLASPGGQTYLSFSDAVAFLKAHPDWPAMNRVRISVEAAQLRDNATGDSAQWMCETLKPISGRGLVACVNLLPQTDPRVKTMIEQAWMQGDFDAGEERYVIARYGHWLDEKDHAARTERLLFEGKTSQAARMLPLLSANARAIAEVRMALMAGSKKADAKLAKLPASARAAAGVLFDRIRYRHAKGKEDDALALFTECPPNPPQPDSWWKLRQYYAREAMAHGQYSKALGLISKAGDLSTENQAEALWLSGWLRFEYLNDTRKAFTDFESLYKIVSTPVSKARAAYWAGRAAAANGNDGIAKDWYERAAGYPTVFYGQLAFAKLHPGRPLALPDKIDGSDGDNELSRVALMLKEGGDAQHAQMFWEQAALTMTKPSSLAGLAERANHAQPGSGVRVAKAALRNNIVLIAQGWPVVALPPQISIEPALTLSIARQESGFDPGAASGANAHGLMQLLPSTARHVAKEQDIAYADGEIYSPQTNLTLGSAYIGQLIQKADGSYVAAIAGYNAGPGNMLRWINDNGRPGQSVDQTIRWIESIPFSETRNYVQRVIENLQVYRAINQPDAPLQIEKDLVR